MIPLRDDNPTVHRAIMTFLIIALNIVVWFVWQGAGFDPALSRSVCRFGLIPGEFLGLLPEGTRIALSHSTHCVIGAEPHYYSIVTSMFLHGGWFHIIGNMWFLFVFGDNVEDILGSFKFILFYLLCGIAAGVTQMVVDPHSAIPMVGASGAISGVMGAYAILFPRAPVYLLIVLGFYITKIAVPALFVLGYWFLLQFVGAIPSLGNQGGGVAFFAHIGGFVAGAILVFFFKDRARVEERRRLLGRFRRRR